MKLLFDDKITLKFMNFGSLGIAGVRKENGGVGRAPPAQHPHIFRYIPAIPNEPKIFYSILTTTRIGCIDRKEP